VLRVESGVISVQIEVAAAAHDRAREIGDLVAAQFPTATRSPDEVDVLTWRSKKTPTRNAVRSPWPPAWADDRRELPDQDFARQTRRAHGVQSR